MNERLLRGFVLLIVALLLVPVVHYQDQERLQQAVAVTRFPACLEIQHRAFFRYCVEEVEPLRARRCESFPEGEFRDQCVANVKREKEVFLVRHAEKLSFSLASHKRLGWIIGALLVVVFLLKGPLVAMIPTYQKFLRRLADGFIPSRYFVGKSWGTLSVQVLALGLLTLALGELIILFI